jgi:hypothetical protein
MRKELKAYRMVVHTFLPLIACLSDLLHEDNQTVYYILAGLTSRSPSMMTELRKLWHMLHENGINMRARYIRSAASFSADRLSRHLDKKRLVARPGHIHGTKLPLRPTHYRSLRVIPQPTTTPLQRGVARPFPRGGRRATPNIFTLDRIEQLAAITQLRPQATAKRSSGYSSRPKMDEQGLAPCTYRDGRGGTRHCSPG